MTDRELVFEQLDTAYFENGYKKLATQEASSTTWDLFMYCPDFEKISYMTDFDELREIVEEWQNEVRSGLRSGR